MIQPSYTPADTPDATASAHSLRLLDLIRKEAAARGGRLPFDRFMELALYAPGLGYYVAGSRKLGPDGDFVTAPELSPLFGQCVAEQCREVLQELDAGDILEFGAGSGALAAQVLSALADRSNLPRSYLILELSPELRERQYRRLAEQVPHLLARVHWLDRLPAGLRGCVLANEVLDAMPVHRFRIGEDGAPRELFVRPSQESLEALWEEPVSPGLREALHALRDRGLAVDPGYESEINMRLAPWVRSLAGVLERGLVLMIDYGYAQSEYYRADRRSGTLMCHYRHRAEGNPFLRLGLQDITAHVDFTAVAEAGHLAGLRLAGYTTQAHFLIGCGLDRLLAQIGVGPDSMDLLLGAKQLVLPSAMGERFRVLGLDKGSARPWTGFSFRDLSNQLGCFETAHPR
ncbi:MAG: SAM-dependent methyltransferase [Chromatiaceae bacterium]|nr:SAM-dependent methyltransferase [Chromatiaceae bacterium]